MVLQMLSPKLAGSQVNLFSQVAGFTSLWKKKYLPMVKTNETTIPTKKAPGFTLVL